MEKISRKNWALIWVLGMAGQICWNIENSWFNTFVYRKIAPDPSIVAWMVGVSAVVSTFCTFLIGTASDRLGRRRPFIAFGYILWGVFTIGFGGTELLPDGKASGLKEAMRVLRDVEGIGICELTNADVVRHVMVQRIVEAYERYETAKNGGKGRK